MRPLVKELDVVAQRLADTAIDLRAVAPWTPDMMFMTSTCFLTSTMIKKITTDLDNINSANDLQACMDGWRYWDGYGEDLWEVLRVAKIELKEAIDTRHGGALAKQQQARDKKRKDQLQMEREKQEKDEEEIRAQLASVGLDKVKRVKIKLHRDIPNATGPSSSILEPQITTTASSADLTGHTGLHHSKVLQAIDTSIPPKSFYATTSESSRKRKNPPIKSTTTGSKPKRLRVRFHVHISCHVLID